MLLCTLGCSEVVGVCCRALLDVERWSVFVAVHSWMSEVVGVCCRALLDVERWSVFVAVHSCSCIVTLSKTTPKKGKKEFQYKKCVSILRNNFIVRIRGELLTTALLCPVLTLE